VDRHRQDGPLLVVGSALEGVTDLLELTAIQALERRSDGDPLAATLDGLRRRHLAMAHGLGGAVPDAVHGTLAEVEALAGSIRATGELPDASYARLLSAGERLSVVLLAAALEAAGGEARPLTAEEVGLRAAGPARAGHCDLPASAEGLRRLRRQLADRILVLTGFYGIGEDGGVVLFGRGGSDDTACAVAAGLDAGSLELWKDVAGIMTADPREVRGAHLVPELSFDEVAQLGAYGSGVVHRGCLEPLRGRSTRIVISSLLGGAAAGTLLVEKLRRDIPRVVALAARRNNGSPALVGAVGDGIGDDPGIRSRLLSCLSAMGVRAEGSVRPSGRSGLSCSVHPDDLTAALGGLHEHFFAPREQARPTARQGAAARNLVSSWNESRLHADRAKSATIRSAPAAVPWRVALEDVLKIGYGAEHQSHYVGGSWQRVRRFTTPSAGALYPFEVFASVVGEGSYLWDVAKGCLVPCGGPPLDEERLLAAGFAAPPGQRLQALLTLVARPWLSMQKYRQRGYAYCHLDVGHLATNLAIYTAALGHHPTVHLRFSRALLAEHLELDGLCREPLAVLAFAGAGDAAGPPEPAAGADPAPAALEPPGQQEALNWQALRGVLSFDSPLALPCAPASAAVLEEPGAGPLDAILPLPAGRAPSAAREWRSAILGRRSAKGFRDEPLSVAQIGELLAALRDEGLATDFALDSAAHLGVRLVARNVEGLAGVFAYSARDHALHQLDARTSDPRPACMHQEIAGRAAAVAVLHAPICRLMASRGYSAFAELHFRAAELAHRLYLAAARLGAVGMTCVGGFDSAECAALARLEGDDEAVYVILLGIPDDGAVKHDRLRVAYSHGHTTLVDD